MLAFGKTDIGRVRACNQDFIFYSPDRLGDLDSLFLLADGMGGHRAGDYASRFVVEHLVSYLKDCRSKTIVEELQSGIRSVNRQLYQKSTEEEELSGMGSTLVAGVISNNILSVANVGDSRLYLSRSDELIQVTRDHSLVEELVSKGEIKRDSQSYKNHKNIITRAMGVEPAVQAEFFEVPLFKGDILLLCSDGLSNMVSDKDIEECIKSDISLERKAEDLIDMANSNGGLDNIAVILIDPQIDEVTPC